ncbi:MAG: RdgB/HAM1 family non-canonical purine NTP pyrophosphatase [bacterium]|nr:RdgB/HAM1 family non-canonical purine NTP pyrophosphatase [bacterium]MDE0644415.1 RdgB/HAM1 family non-canonical purine NTP pyrophosphatase [bacterium]
MSRGLGRVVVASKNPDKVAELESLLVRYRLVEEVIRGREWPDVVEDAPTLTGNALLKARQVWESTGFPVVADDTGLEVRALDGAPGVLTARYAGPDATYRSNREALLTALIGIEDRRACFRTVVVAITAAGQTVLAEGVLEGEITWAARGSGGFGYDPVFEMQGRTLAEMSPDEKEQISHRARAVAALADALRNLPEN